MHLVEEPASHSGVLDWVTDVFGQAGQVNDHTAAIENISVLVTIRVKDVRGRLAGSGNLNGLVLTDGGRQK